jgi:hypothetical protein
MGSIWTILACDVLVWIADSPSTKYVSGSEIE